MWGRTLAATGALCALLLGAAPASAAPAPPNDSFADATAIVAPLTNVWADNRGASTEPGEPTPRGLPGGASVWFDWTAEKTGGASFSACWGIEEKGLVGVYTGDAVDALTPAPLLLGRSDCEYGFLAVAGVTYRVQVEGELDPAGGAAATGESGLILYRFPYNDDFEAAQELPSFGSDAAASDWGNLGATKQPGEPVVGGNPGGSSVWFTWTAPTSGTFQISACAATFPPLLGVFTGSKLTELTAIAAGSGEPGLQCNASPLANGQLSFQGVAGTRYDLSVDGRGGASGQFLLYLVAGNGGMSPLSSGLPRPGSRIVRYRIDRESRSAAFRLGSTLSDSTFRCRLDRQRWARCGAKAVFHHLAFGRHTFRAVAVNAEGLADKSAARRAFKIARPA
jgi:hypothetical protein